CLDIGHGVAGLDFTGQMEKVGVVEDFGLQSVLAKPAQNTGLNSSVQFLADLRRNAATDDAAPAREDVRDVRSEIVRVSVRADCHLPSPSLVTGITYR